MARVASPSTAAISASNLGLVARSGVPMQNGHDGLGVAYAVS
jgi:hypothetical protein